MLDRKPPPFYQIHIFICTHEVSDHRCCGRRNSHTLFKYARSRVCELKLTGACVTQTGCLGRCMSGPSLVIYPDNIWYSPHSQADIDAILINHVGTKTLVENLLMPNTDLPVPGYDVAAAEENEVGDV
ncbi:MAG: (2Fe-2S) ferredoxin domain-containing protein [Alphaproteobacteria bacterium]